MSNYKSVPNLFAWIINISWTSYFGFEGRSFGVDCTSLRYMELL